MLTDMLLPVPPLARSDSGQEARWNAFTSAYCGMLNGLGLFDYEQQVNASHPRHSYEEDLVILQHAGMSILDWVFAPHNDKELGTWYFDEANKDYAYEYHKTFLQMLNSVDAPQSHWLLKTPLHTLFLDTLLRHYPSASLIMIHRLVH
ncbi:unnamed protein product, partial [Rotaria sp. Silwood2]